MPPTTRLGAFLVLALLILGCGKKADPDASPAPAPNPAPGAQPPAGSPGIEGTYLVVGGEMMGEKATDEEIAKEPELDRKVVISKDQIQFKLFKRETVQYKLDSSKSPKEIDIVSDEPGEKSKGNHGIYKVEGDTLTLFIMGAREPQLRPREFKTLAPPKDGKDADKQVGGVMILTLKKVSGDTTFISEPPPKPKPKLPAGDELEPVAAELTKKGFVAEKMPYGKSPGVNVTVPSTVPLETIKELSGRPRVLSITFKKTLFTDPDHPVTDETIQALNKLDGLTSLTFESCPKITAAALRNLGRFPAITSVKITSSPVDDAATEELAQIKTLEFVDLDGEKLTDKSLANLAKIKSLKTLWLRDAKVTASGIKMLNSLPNLTTLGLQGMPSVDAALGELNLPKLEFLNLVKSDISDEGLGKLPVFPKLENLTLGGLKLTDAGLNHLQKQLSLKSLTLVTTKVTKEAAEGFPKLKPGCFVSRID